MCPGGSWTHWPGDTNERHYADIFRCIFFNEILCIWTKILLKFVPRDPRDGINIGSDNGLVLFRQRGIIWTNVDIVHQQIYFSGLNELIFHRELYTGRAACWQDRTSPRGGQCNEVTHISLWPYPGFNMLTCRCSSLIVCLIFSKIITIVNTGHPWRWCMGCLLVISKSDFV